jgi:hypothetical protein
MSSHLRGTLPKGQGVLVGDVGPNSPAAKAGLRTHDVLVSYDDQKLYAPEQLVKLVLDGTPGHEVTIGYVREGKSGTVRLTLGERPAMAEEHGHFQRPPSPDEFREFFEQYQAKNDNAALELIDALRLTRLGNQRWRAEIEYRTKDGKKEHKTFEGTREDIRRDIQTAKDMPANQQRQLLRCLNLDQSPFEMRFPFAPYGGPGPVFWDHR